MGLMAGGIAHDFDNLLAVSWNGDAAESRLAGSPDLHYLRDITAAGSRAAELCRQLMAYSGRSTAARQTMNLSNWSRRRRA